MERRACTCSWVRWAPEVGSVGLMGLVGLLTLACGTSPSASTGDSPMEDADPSGGGSTAGADSVDGGPSSADTTDRGGDDSADEAEAQGDTAEISGHDGEGDADGDDATSSTGADEADSGSSDAADGEASSSDDGGTTGDSDCPAHVVLLGYWPPTNEMMRPFSTDPELNEGSWVGENWRGFGYDVRAFFPEFPPDGDPSNDPIGSLGAVGSEKSDMRVDYQDSSADFWRIMDRWQPTILITTSRGGSIGWELEAIEGGHRGGSADDPSGDWISDGFGEVTLPTEATIEPRSWAAIGQYRDGETLATKLPIDEIKAATEALGLVSVEIDHGTSGNFLSGFSGLHGLVYNTLTPHNMVAGHIHVGIQVSVEDARSLLEETLETVLELYPAELRSCSN